MSSVPSSGIGLITPTLVAPGNTLNTNLKVLNGRPKYLFTLTSTGTTVNGGSQLQALAGQPILIQSDADCYVTHDSSSATTTTGFLVQANTFFPPYYIDATNPVIAMISSSGTANLKVFQLVVN